MEIYFISALSTGEPPCGVCSWESSLHLATAEYLEQCLAPCCVFNGAEFRVELVQWTLPAPTAAQFEYLLNYGDGSDGAPVPHDVGRAVLQQRTIAARPRAAGDLAPPRPSMDTPVRQLGFKVRIDRVCHYAKIETLGDLVEKTEAELCCQRNFGDSSMNEVTMKLEGWGLKLATHPKERRI